MGDVQIAYPHCCSSQKKFILPHTNSDTILYTIYIRLFRVFLPFLVQMRQREAAFEHKFPLFLAAILLFLCVSLKKTSVLYIFMCCTALANGTSYNARNTTQILGEMVRLHVFLPNSEIAHRIASVYICVVCYIERNEIAGKNKVDATP